MAVTTSALSVSELVSWGVLHYAFAVLLAPMVTDTGWTTVAVSGAFSAALFTAGLAAPVVGVALERWGSRSVMLAGSLVGVAGVTGWATSNTLPRLYGSWLLIGVAMASTLYEPAFATIVEHHRGQKHSAVLAIALTGALAATIFQPSTAWLLEAVGWRRAGTALASLLALIALPCHLLLPPHRRSPTVRRHPLPPAPASTPSGLLWRTAVGLALANGVAVGVTVHRIAFLVDRGVRPIEAASLAGLVGVAKLAGRVAAATGVRRWSAGRMAGSAAMLQAVSLALPVASTTRPVLIAHVIGFGAAAGSLTVLRPWLIDGMVGPGTFARADGRVQFVVATVKAAAPLLVGAAVTSRLGYTGALTAGAAMLVGVGRQFRRIAARLEGPG